MALPTPGGFIQGAPAICLELDLPLVGGVPGEGGSAGRSGTPILPNRHPILHPRIGALGNSQGRDPSTRERNSQGEDPRTLEESSEGGNVGTRQIPSQRKDPRAFEVPVKGWRVQKKAERKEVEKKSEAQKKSFVDKAQSTIDEIMCVGRKKKEKGKKRNKSPKNNFWEDLEDRSSSFF